MTPQLSSKQSAAVASRPSGIPNRLHLRELFQQVDVVTGARTPSERAEPDSFFIRIDHIIDITEAVRQYIEVTAEMQPLCRPDCPALCPECSRTFGMDACTCDRTPIDSQ